ncbi:hypothetical protein B0T16DRAFT_64125 [Cercophora newfieldiana]|uniref:Uncharacterized protein n=1 Tax=Cercophora newfieldiana TaxID=92897 RepID=A0AA39YUB4_9PEZI|nr:hypothetical protein B0T16DRAFT_64125 [Cercophora newfieldiana]
MEHRVTIERIQEALPNTLRGGKAAISVHIGCFACRWLCRHGIERLSASLDIISHGARQIPRVAFVPLGAERRAKKMDGACWGMFRRWRSAAGHLRNTRSSDHAGCHALQPGLVIFGPFISILARTCAKPFCREGGRNIKRSYRGWSSRKTTQRKATRPHHQTLACVQARRGLINTEAQHPSPTTISAANREPEAPTQAI